MHYAGTMTLRVGEHVKSLYWNELPWSAELQLENEREHTP